MDAWVWLAAYLVGFALLQVLLYRRFRRDVPQREATTPPGQERATTRSASTDDVADDPTVRCQHCGATNESASGYRFCRSCAGSLR